MTLPDDLVKASKEAKCLRFDNDGRQCLFADPRFTRVEWQSGHYVHPECAVAAVLRALLESGTARSAVRQAAKALPRRADITDSFIRHVADACLAAIAKLADDE